MCRTLQDGPMRFASAMRRESVLILSYNQMRIVAEHSFKMKPLLISIQPNDSAVRSSERCFDRRMWLNWVVPPVSYTLGTSISWFTDRLRCNNPSLFRAVSKQRICSKLQAVMTRDPPQYCGSHVLLITSKCPPFWQPQESAISSVRASLVSRLNVVQLIERQCVFDTNNLILL